MLGATGTIGKATTQALLRKGYDVTYILRPSHKATIDDWQNAFPGAKLRFADVTDVQSLQSEGFHGEAFDVVISCLASRNGDPKDAWAIDHQAMLNVLQVVRQTSPAHFILLSAICVQKPRLAFQHAKLAAEDAIVRSGLTYSIVRPTAYFKSLSGQIERLKQGKPFLLFGNGELTACKPISDEDLAAYLVGCIDDPKRHNQILPIGGPGPALTPRAQGEHLFNLLGREAKFKHVPVALMDAIIFGLSMAAHVVPSLAAKAEFARIGKYYATESMLVLDTESGAYNPDATPSTGKETLFDYYARVLSGEAHIERGEHSVF